MTQSISGSPCTVTQWIDLFTIFDFSAAFDFRGFFSGMSSLCLKID